MARGSQRGGGRRRRSTPAARPSPVDERTVRWVTKRDGRRVPFQRAKIRATIAAAAGATGGPEGFDDSLADEIAGLVELALAERLRRAARPAADPRTEEVQELVERALMELGRAEVARAFILHGDKRRRAREVVRVHRGEPRPSPVRVRETDGVSGWSKGRIVASLVGEAELPRSAAEEVASAVERRVLASGLRRVTTGLVRELVGGELAERGWTRAWRRQAAVGVGRPAIDRALRGLAVAPWEDPRAGAPAEDALAEEALRRFLLDDVLDEGVAELHRAGDLHLCGLGSAHLPLTLSVEAELLASANIAGPERRATALLGAVGALARDVSRGLVIERPARVLAPLLAASPEALPRWLASLDAVAGAAGVRIDLGSSGPAELPFTAALVEALAADTGVAGLRLFLDGHELESVLARGPGVATALESALASGRVVGTWGEAGDGETCVGPGCHRRAGERGALACVGAVALNLPRLARRAGPWSEEILFRGLSELVQAALESARSLARFRRERVAPRPRALRVRGAVALVPVGLREALTILGDGEPDLEKGARLFGLLVDAAERFAVPGAPPAVAAPFFGERAAQRFAWMDARAEDGPRQGWLFQEAGDERRPSYGSGWGLTPVAGLAPGRAEAECLRTLPAGALHPTPPAPASEPVLDGKEPHVAAWKRFELFRRSHAGELSLELFPSPSARAAGLRDADVPHAGTRQRASSLRPLA